MWHDVYIKRGDEWVWVALVNSEQLALHIAAELKSRVVTRIVGD